MDKNNRTEAWKYYEYGREYNNRLVPNQYRTVDVNWEFFSGNQWLHIPETPAMSRLSRPVFNIIKRIVSLFVASICASPTSVSFEPLDDYDGDDLADPDGSAAACATAELRNLYEKFKMDYRTREALLDGAVSGDYCAHFYWNPEARPYGGAYGGRQGEIEMELVDGINVMFGNPNCRDVESQPYILIVGRDTVENLKAEAARYHRESGETEQDGEIGPDAGERWQTGVGGETEIAGDDDKSNKALYVYLYTKVSREIEETDEQGRSVRRTVTTVHVTKATRDANIFEDVDTGLTHYPIAWGNWEKQKNQYHGRALVTGIVPNQIFINTMFAMIFRHLQLQSFPKTVFNADLIGQWNNEIGVALGVRGLMPGQDLTSVASVLQPADMSNQIVMCIDKCMEYTKECLGATDAQMGSLALENTSALMVLQSSSEAPLENPRQALLEWHEDIARILLDMMGSYYGQRPLLREREFRELVTGPDGAPLIDPATGRMQEKTVVRRVMEDYDFSRFKDLWLNVRVNAGATTQYSEIAAVQTLDKLRQEGVLELADYLERVPDRLIPRKQELIDAIREKNNVDTAQSGGPPQSDALRGTASAGAKTPQGSAKSFNTAGSGEGGALEAAKRISRMPGAIQQRFNALPNTAQRALLRRYGG
ncbi:MAG: hypothetical protein K6G17_01625 [Oscillospiraceae bacterium]|nr:hypothetical protein [Oscillospiraceae bacterium]